MVIALTLAPLETVATHHSAVYKATHSKFQPTPKERVSLFFGVKASLVPHDKVNNERNLWNRAYTPPSKNS